MNVFVEAIEKGVFLSEVMMIFRKWTKEINVHLQRGIFTMSASLMHLYEFRQWELFAIVLSGV